jgi:hypothetical protein
MMQGIPFAKLDYPPYAVISQQNNHLVSNKTSFD